MRNKKLFFLGFCFIYFVLAINTYSYDSLLFRNEIFAIHPKTGLIANFYSADFKSFEGSIDCGVFNSGNGYNITGMLFAELPFKSALHLSLGLGYINRSGNLLINSSFPSRDTSTGEVVNVSTENSLEASLGYLELQPEIRYVVVEKFISGPLRLFGGLRVYFPISNTFTQKEKIVSPENAIFIIDGRQLRERNIASGSITSINKLGFGISLGIENMLKVSRKDYFTQQFVFDYNFSDVTKDASWKAFGIRFEIGFRFSFIKEREAPAPIVPTPPLPEPPLPKKDSVIVIVKPEEKPLPPELLVKIQNPKFELNVGNELLATLPLVNAVFFNRNSAEIPSNYIINNVPLPSLFGADAVAIHDYVLLRIASIMKNNPKARIIVEGATSGKEQEPDGLILAQKRADAVTQALINLGVEPNRIKTKANIMPNFISNQEYEEGKIENQRADIILINAPLQEYVALQKFAELKTNVDFIVDFKNIKNYDSLFLMSDFLGTKVIAEQTGKYEYSNTKRVEQETKLHKLDANLVYGSIKTSDSLIINIDTIPKKVIELVLSNFQAILRFDYNSSVLSDDNKGLLKQLAEFLPEGSTIIIYGSTDALGTEKRNIQLEGERAKVTEQFIKNISGNKFFIETAPNRDKFPEQTPQGRFLNRSIVIKVKKQ